MKIVISGASGFVGSALVNFFGSSPEYEIFKLVRRRTNKPDEVEWNPTTGTIDKEKLEDIKADAIIHLSGENVLGIWTTAKKKEIVDSRVLSTRLIASTITQLQHKPSVFICASGMSYYGNDTHGTAVDESAPKGSGFLADVTQDWENEAYAVKDVRVVTMRISMVLDPQGGALQPLVLAYKCFMGGVIAEGSQWMSWMSLYDMKRAIEHILKNPSISGPVNFASPNAVRNEEFTRILGKVLHRPTFMWVPPFVFSLGSYVVGDFFENTLLASVRIQPKKLLDNGFQFEDTDLESTLSKMLA